MDKNSFRSQNLETRMGGVESELPNINWSYHSANAVQTFKARAGMLFIHGTGNTNMASYMIMYNDILDFGGNYVEGYRPTISNDVVSLPTAGYYRWFYVGK